MKKALRSVIINLLDDQNGIDQQKYQEIVEFCARHFPGMMDDVFVTVNGTEDRCWIEEEDADELRAVQIF